MIILFFTMHIQFSKITLPNTGHQSQPIHTEHLFFDTTPPEPKRRKNRKERRAEK